MAGQRRLDSNARSLKIANLADHDDVWVLPQDRAQRTRKVEPDGGLDLHLIDPRKLIFDRILDRENLALSVVEPLESRIEGGCLAAAGRTGDQDDSVRLVKKLLITP